jgi:phenylacetate-CoA ligase
MKQSFRETVYYNAHRMLLGSSVGELTLRFAAEDQQGVPDCMTSNLLVGLLDHCARHVPYYTEIIARSDNRYQNEPEAYLQNLPVLTKEIIRGEIERLKSRDLGKRSWTYNTSGGSTGEPVRLIQDRYFKDNQMAIQRLSFSMAGREFGQPAVHLWGSERDILQGSIGVKMKVLNGLTNDRILNAFMMTPEKMRDYLRLLNEQPPRLIIAYAQAIFELAQFAEQEGIEVTPQTAILSSAGTLYDFMRARIERVFGCRVFNRYGSREVGDIACECSAHAGLHVFPWGNFVEIVDEEGNPVSPGTEGNILVTNLYNFAMPLIRYAIGDRGILSPKPDCNCGRRWQILEKVTGRNVDMFVKKDGTIIDGEYFTHLLYFRDWVKKFQVVQRGYSSILYRIVKYKGEPRPAELEEINQKTKIVMGDDCEIEFEFLNDIPTSSSGKYRYTISELKR